MHVDDEPVGRLLTRRELVALFGAAAAAATTYRVGAQTSSAASITVPNCVVHPQQTEGPYFVDERLLRSDIRSDSRSGANATGTALVLNLSIVQVSSAGACAPLAGAQVDVWQCDAIGRYSDVRDRTNDTAGQTFLRGHQITSPSGSVVFTTIYPGWYRGRAVHIHFKVRTTAGSRAYEFTSQFYFDERLTDRVHARAPYSTHAGQRVRNEDDGIFRDGGRQLTLPVVEAREGYAASFTIGIRPGDPTSRRWGRRQG